MRHITGRKITTFKLGHPVFDGGIQWCMFPVMFLSEGREFRLAPWLAGKNKTSGQLASSC
jgi:hypothetical protein